MYGHHEALRALCLPGAFLNKKTIPKKTKNKNTNISELFEIMHTYERVLKYWLFWFLFVFDIVFFAFVGIGFLVLIYSRIRNFGMIISCFLFFFASAGPKLGPVCSDRSRTLRGFTAGLINNRNPRSSISGNCRDLAIKGSIVHPHQGV